MKRKVTLKDVASVAAVSNQTVSRVINDHPDVAKNTRERVWQVIRDLNYHPNVIARSLIQQRSFTLGVVTSGLGYSGPSGTLNGITRQAEEMGYSVLLKEVPDSRTNNTHPLLNTLLTRQVEGIIWAMPEIGDNREAILASLHTLHMPIIFLTMHESPDVSSVSIDNYEGGRMATQHLIEQGYSYIGHISGPMDWWEARQRQAGYLDALKSAGLPVITQSVTEGDWSADSGAAEMHRLLNLNPGLDAVFVSNDQMAIGALYVAHQRGLQVPADLGIVGFDDIPEVAYCIPPITTVVQDVRSLGSTAVKELINVIEAGYEDEVALHTRHVWLTPEMLVRQSSIRTQA